jgi:hypothetical protein
MIAAPQHPFGRVATRVIAAEAPRAASGSAIGTAVVVAMVYVTWTVSTYLLEGARQTLLRPEAQFDRLIYALVANVLAGCFMPLWALRVLAANSDAQPRIGRLCSAPITAISVAAAASLGLLMLLPFLPVAGHGFVYVNVLCQVLPTSIAEVIVCWILVGAAVDAAFVGRQSAGASTVKWVCGAALFAVYHFAHSPPYNEWRTVAFLAGVGLLTGGFLLVTGEVYGTIVLHSILATAGVIGALSQGGRLSELQSPQPLLYAAAAVSLAVLVALDAAWFRGPVRREAATPGGRMS